MKLLKRHIPTGPNAAKLSYGILLPVLSKPFGTDSEDLKKKKGTTLLTQKGKEMSVGEAAHLVKMPTTKLDDLSSISKTMYLKEIYTPKYSSDVRT